MDKKGEWGNIRKKKISKTLLIYKSVIDVQVNSVTIQMD